jgi:hypothetical protein
VNATIDTLRSGAFLTGERIRLVATALLIASAAGFLYLVVTAHGAVDQLGRPLGTDFSNVYAAGTYALEGNAAAAFDPPQQFAREQTIFGPDTQFYGWHYPPFFLFIAAALALMPYGLALFVWQATTLALYLLVIGGIVTFKSPSPERGGMACEARQGGVTSFAVAMTPTRQPSAADLPLSGGGIGSANWLLLALAFPAVLINIGHGQNGFLTAALLGGGLVMLDRRPLVAGILFGLMVYKPQYGLLLPLVLVISGRWRAFAAAAVTVVLLTVATTAVFGPSIWHAFAASTAFTRSIVLEQGNTGWYKIQSVFAWARMWGAGIPLAYALQAVVIAMLVVAMLWLWRSPAHFAVKAAALCIGTILATPYSFDYDMMVLAPPIAFLATDGIARGFAPWEKTALAALWLVPLVARPIAQASMIPLGVPAMAAMILLIFCRAQMPSPVAFCRMAVTMLHPAGPSRSA